MVVLSMVVIAFFHNPFSFYVGADADPCFTRPNRTMLSANTSRSWMPSTGAIRNLGGWPSRSWNTFADSTRACLGQPLVKPTL